MNASAAVDGTQRVRRNGRRSAPETWGILRISQ